MPDEHDQVIENLAADWLRWANADRPVDSLTDDEMTVLSTPVNDDDPEGLLLAQSPRFQSLLARSRKSIKQGKGLSQEDFWKAVAERIQDRPSPACRHP